MEKEALDQEELVTENEIEKDEEITTPKDVEEPVAEKPKAEKKKEPEKSTPANTYKSPRVVKGVFSGMQPGYYVITNVFSKPSYAKRWSDYLKTEGFLPQIFINPKNDWHYVFTSRHEQRQEAYKTFQKLVKLDNFKEIWIYKINMD